VSRPSRWEQEAAKATSEVARRAIRRLDVLEWLILGGAAALAIGGGALVAMILVGRASPAFRMTWMVTSVVLFVLPGAVALVRLRKEREREAAESTLGKRDDG
jgi:uncharacterized membrane protein YqjE